MTITLLAPDGLAVTAQQERQANAVRHGGGAGRPLGGRSGFRVDTPANVLTATSTTWTLGACTAEIDPGASAAQGMYGWANDSNVSGPMTAADATYDRKDIVYIQINDPTAGDGTGALSYTPQYAAGPADGTNNPPALPPRSFLVGTINVPKAGGGSPSVVLNTAKYVAAGGILPIYSQTELDALTKYDGLRVARMDLPGRPDFVYDGASWNGQAWTAYTPAWGGWVNLGDGYQSSGSYMMIGPKLCMVRMKLKAGATNAALGGGNIAVTLPFTSAAGQATNGEGQWLPGGPNGGLQKIMLSNPESNNMAAIYTNPSGTAIAQAPGAAGFGYGPQTEIHATITYRTA